MTEVQSENTDLKANYAAQVAADLAHNAKEQERIRTEVAALDEQLRALEEDRALLENMERALVGGTSAAAAAPAEASAPAAAAIPRQAAAKSKRSQEKKPRTPVKASAKAAGKASGKASAKAPAQAKKPAAKAANGKAPEGRSLPTVGEVIRTYLVGQSEPRSTAEITGALGDSHPERAIKSTVVRTTVENLVAKGLVERSKQGSSVFYTAVTQSADNASEAVAVEAGTAD
ncbi:MAG: hypothetical protein HOV68_14410 [Streptomycetaceae bacterium]|nr:hypothetical protein [Streptomycetaceae bacterium]